MVVLERKGLKVYYRYDTQLEAKLIKESLTFFMPGAEFSPRYRDGYWDGNVRFYNGRHEWFWFGLLSRVLNTLSANKIECEVCGFEIHSIDWIEFGENFLSKERTYQRKAIQNFLIFRYGILKIPTRGGKTFIAAEIIRLLREREDVKVLFVVDTIDLFKQAIGDIASVLGIDENEVGRIRGEEFEIKGVNVGMIQTIQRILKTTTGSKESRERKRMFKKYIENTLDFLIVDEIQDYAYKLDLVKKCKKLKNILFLSATPYKEDKIQNLNIDSLSGGIIYEVDERKLVKSTVLSENRVLLFWLKHEETLESEYREMVKELIYENEKRDEVIVKVLNMCDELGLKTLAIFNSVVHGESIQLKTGYNFISGKNNAKEREEAKERFLKKENIILVSDIWKKGITLPEAQIMFNIDGGKESSLVIQRRGRVLGTAEGKNKALIIDFIDDYTEYFNTHSLSRIEAYEEKIGMKNIDVLEIEDGEFYSNVFDYIQNWFS